MDTKRTRFGFVCGNTSFVTADMLPSLRVKSMECVLTANKKQFVVFTVEKPVRASDVLKSIEGFNSSSSTPLTLEKFNEDDVCMIVTFEKGQRFMQHPFYSIVQEVKEDSSNDPEMRASKVWEWTATFNNSMPSASKQKKRVVDELASDLVEDAILPSASKRERNGPKPSPLLSAEVLEVITPSSSLWIVANHYNDHEHGGIFAGSGRSGEKEPVLIRYIPSEAEVQEEFTPSFFWFNPYEGVSDNLLPKDFLY